MPTLKTSIARVMLFIFFLCIVMAALGNANGFWAGFSFTAAILAVCTATVGAFSRENRVPWAGFALAGWTSLLVWLTLTSNVGYLEGRPHGLFCHLINHYSNHLNPGASGGGPFIAYRQVSQALDVILTGLAGSLLAQFMVVRRNAER